MSTPFSFRYLNGLECNIGGTSVRWALVISKTALMGAYGRGKQHRKAKVVFHKMQTSGPEPSPIAYQIILKLVVEVCF